MNAIITEGADDIHFLEALANLLNSHLACACSLQCTPMKSLNEKKLVADLIGKIGEIRRGKIRRIGIVIDQDIHSQQERLDFLNEAIKKAYQQDGVLKTVNQLFEVKIDSDTTQENWKRY